MTSPKPTRVTFTEFTGTVLLLCNQIQKKTNQLYKADWRPERIKCYKELMALLWDLITYVRIHRPTESEDSSLQDLRS